jgi:hypothetical protein
METKRGDEKMPTHTLEKIAEELGTKFDEEKVHAALLLAYTQSVYGAMRRNTSPTPLYRIIYDMSTNNLQLIETEGRSYVPMSNALDIDALDIVVISNLRDIPVLFEGETGVGKTYVTHNFHKTVFPKESAVSLRLSGSVYDNIFQHFLKGTTDAGGMPKSVVDQDVIDKTAAMLIDEPNRGEPDDLLQLIDNSLSHNGQYYKLGIKIPAYNTARKIVDSGRRKKIDIKSAINPANAKYSGTVPLDAAVDDRFLKSTFGNASLSAGSSLWLSDGSSKSHDIFMQKFSANAAKYLGISPEAFKDVNSDWLTTYAWITDPARTEKPILYSALEFSDMMITVMMGSLPKTFEYEKEIVSEWGKKLGVGIEITEKMPESEKVKRIQEIVDTFKVPIIFRDIIQTKKLADVITTFENLRDSLIDPDPVRAYLDMPKYISMKEVASAATLLARNKQNPNSPSPTHVVNEVLQNYISLSESFSEDMELPNNKFSIYDPPAGIKKTAIVRALREAIRNSNRSSGVLDGFISTLGDYSKKLKTHLSSSHDVRNVLTIRSMADLLTFAGFVHQYKPEVEPLIRKHGKRRDATELIHDLANFYYGKREEGAIVLPEIYQHRIQRTLGI